MANELLKGKKGLIFGPLDERSIAWKVAERVSEEGAEIVISNAPVALRMGKVKELGESLGSEVIPADATKNEDLEQLLDQAVEKLGAPVDFVLHSVGMSPNVRKGNPYTGTKHEFFHQTLDTSAISLHRTLQVAMEKDAIAEWGSVVSLSYIAAERVFPDYNDMADAKALLESITRNFGYHYGKKKNVRVNSISQSPTPTTAGQGIKGFDSFMAFADKMSPLGNAPSDACADYCVSLFSDLSRYVTMQTLYHDGGFSRTGISPELMDKVSDD
ncbi:MAG: enoyl-ACP reductase [Flavobacteriales bacterium]